MTVKSLILSFSISLLLVGCASEEDREKARQARFQADLTKAQESCLSIGFKSGTAEMPVCLQAQLNNNIFYEVHEYLLLILVLLAIKK